MVFSFSPFQKQVSEYPSILHFVHISSYINYPLGVLERTTWVVQVLTLSNNNNRYQKFISVTSLFQCSWYKFQHYPIPKIESK